MVTDLYPPFFEGGYELDCWDISQGLRARGYELVVLTSTHGVESSSVDGEVHRILSYVNDDICPGAYSDKLKRLPGYLRAQAKKSRIYRSNMRQTARVAEKFRPHVAYVWNMSGITVSPLLALYKQMIPCAYRLGAYWLTNAMRYHVCPNYVRRFLRGAMTGVHNLDSIVSKGLFVANSEFLRLKHIAAGVPEANIEVLPLGVRLPLKTASLLDASGFRMIFAGRLCEEKGVHVCIEALGELANSDNIGTSSLDIVGTGSDDYVARLKREIDSRGLADRVRFLGFVPREDLMSILPLYHVLLFPSVWEEPFGLVLIEAMACGLPVVGSPVGGAADILVDGENCLAFPSGDHMQLAACVKRLVADRELLRQLGMGGRRTAQERFDYDRILDAHERFILEAIERVGVDGSSRRYG